MPRPVHPPASRILNRPDPPTHSQGGLAGNPSSVPKIAGEWGWPGPLLVAVLRRGMVVRMVVGAGTGGRGVGLEPPLPPDFFYGFDSQWGMVYE